MNDEPSAEQARLRPGITTRVAPVRREPQARASRFVTQSHALGGPVANPWAIAVTAAIGVALYLVGRRLSATS